METVKSTNWPTVLTEIPIIMSTRNARRKLASKCTRTHRLVLYSDACVYTVRLQNYTIVYTNVVAQWQNSLLKIIKQLHWPVKT